MVREKKLIYYKEILVLEILLLLFKFYIIFAHFSGQGDTMVSILIEFHGFWAYENREAMAADTGDESSHV